MEIDAICEFCKNQFKVNKSVVDEQVKRAIDGEILYIMSYDCPNCKNTHYIQVDNDGTKQLLVHCENLMKRLMVYRSKNLTPPKKLKRSFENARKKLKNARINLMKKYNETEMVDVKTKETNLVRFSL